MHANMDWTMLLVCLLHVVTMATGEENYVSIEM